MGKSTKVSEDRLGYESPESDTSSIREGVLRPERLQLLERQERPRDCQPAHSFSGRWWCRRGLRGQCLRGFQGGLGGSL